MNNVLRIGGLGLLATACSFHASIGTNNRPPPNRPPPPGYHPPPAVAVRPVQMQQVGPTAAPKPIEPVNVQKIQVAQSRSPKGCGFTEVSPGNWVKVDCHAYNIAGRAVDHLSPRKARVVSSKQVIVKPFSLVQLQQLKSFRGGAVGGAAPTSAAPVKADPIPGAVDHRAQNLEGPIKDQGPVGSCTAFSLSATIDNAAIHAGKMQGGDKNLAASPNHVWIGYAIPEMGTAADSSLNRSIATLALWPQNNKEACEIANATYEQECGFETNVTPGTWKNDPALVDKNNKSNASPAYKITGIEKLKTLPPNMDELTSTLASGTSLWIAMRIDGSVWTNAKMKQGVIPDWSAPSGGHAIEMAGYRDTPAGKQFLIHNSWGTSWGDQGYAWVSEKMVDQFMNYAYKVKIEGGTPATPQATTDNDCGPDELVDLTSGLCALMCGANRANGGCNPQSQQPVFPIPPIFQNIFGSALPH